MSSGPGSRALAALAEAGMDGAVDVLLDQEQVPMALASEIMDAIRGPSMRAVMEVRIDQIARHGHGTVSDGGLPLPWLPGRAIEYLTAGRDLTHPGDKQNLAVAKRRLAIAAALCLAAMDRIEIEQAKSGGEG